MFVLRAFSKQTQNYFKFFQEKISHETLTNLLPDLLKGNYFKNKWVAFVLNKDQFYFIKE